MTLSIVGMFLGPLMSWAIGDLAVFQSQQKMTEARLEADRDCHRPVSMTGDANSPPEEPFRNNRTERNGRCTAG